MKNWKGNTPFIILLLLGFILAAPWFCIGTFIGPLFGIGDSSYPVLLITLTLIYAVLAKRIPEMTIFVENAVNRILDYVFRYLL